jgi:predicted NodU family carbamoyl transferase
MAKKYKAVYQSFDQYPTLSKQVAQLISEGNVIGWFQ